MIEIEEDKIYALDKNEVLIAVFDKDDENTIINPRVNETQNKEAVFTFYISPNNPKWAQINNPENLYVVDNKVFSTNFEGCFTETISDNNEDLILVTAYEREKLLSRKYVKAWNSETGFENIDTFMVVVLSNGDLPLKNNGDLVVTNYEPGTSGYVLDALLHGTGWITGTCDVEGSFDFETDQVDIYENILKVQQMWGGILIFDSINKVVHHRDETKFLPYDGYEVKYQKNMQSLEKLYNNKIITKLCPLGEGGLNIKSVNNGSEWLTNNTYTMSTLEGIENNPDIYDPEQLKRWGQRKLADLCKPRKELTVNAVLLKQVKGYEQEDIHLNDIVDVINYAYSENDIEQLRVVGYDHGIWDYSDAVLELSDVTLESTDIFKKNVQASNSINDGTLNATKVVSFFKNGKSIDEALRIVDRTISETTTELIKKDDALEARIVTTETDMNTLSDEIVAERNKVTELTATVGNINARISDVADVTTSQETNNAVLSFQDISTSEPLEIRIKPLGTNISYLYPRDDLYPSDNLFMTDRTLRFKNTTTNKSFDYELPNDLLYYDENNYDEFKLDYKNKKCIVEKRIGYNADGTTYILPQSQTITYQYPKIALEEGNYTISLLGYTDAYLFVKLMIKNLYTTQLASTVELENQVALTRNMINLGLEEKLDGEKFTGANIMLAINDDTSSATINAGKISFRRKRI